MIRRILNTKLELNKNLYIKNIKTYILSIYLNFIYLQKTQVCNHI